jgi:hypothetical protein
MDVPKFIQGWHGWGFGRRIKNMKKRTIVGVMSIVVIAAIVIFAGCIEEKAPDITPPTTSVTPGYVRSYDHQLDFGYEYPDDWEAQATECKFPRERWEEYTKAEGESRIVIDVKSTSLKSLAEVKGFDYIDRDSILKESFVEINDRKAYEVIFKQYPDRKAKWVIFLANEREYTIQCYTTEELYDEYEEIFDHVINSFFIE